MEKIKRILVLTLQLLSLVALYVLLTKGGIAAFVGKEFVTAIAAVIDLGVALMAVVGSLIGWYLPLRTKQILRDTDIHIMKYSTHLVGLQLVLMVLTGGFSPLIPNITANLPSMFTGMLPFTFLLFAIMSPLTYIKHLFTQLKSAQDRDPRSMIKQFFM